MKSITIKLTNSLVIFIMTGIIYIFMEVTFSSVLPKMQNKYLFKPIPAELYHQMACKPATVTEKEGYYILADINRFSLIGASSLWMFLVGGICGLCLYFLYYVGKNDGKGIFPKFKMNLFFLCLAGSVIITLIELGAGFILNGLCHFYIWDYTQDFLNYMGQICFSHSLLYFILVTPLAFWFFHFLESQYDEIDQEPYSLVKHYTWLLNPISKNLHSRSHEEVLLKRKRRK